jgi:hypothetical protein
MKKKALTRRDFLKSSASAAVAGALFMHRPDEIFASSGKKSRVVLVRDADVLGENNKPDDGRLQKMLDRAVTALLDEKEPARAWKQLVKPNDILGIKTNVWRYLPTPRGLEKAIRSRALEAGLQEKNIGIRDRGLLGDPIFKNATALINARPLRTHHWSGVGSLLKNYIMFVEEPSDYHWDSCADLAAIWKLPVVKGKTRLNILVMLTPLFHGLGPHHYNANYTWPYRGILVGTDPVAVDSVGVRVLMAKRKQFFEEDRPLNPPPKHVFLADSRHHLGTADPEKIELVKLGWEEDILI